MITSTDRRNSFEAEKSFLDDEVQACYLTLLRNLRHATTGGQQYPRTLGLTGCSRRQGVSTAASHLAATAAASGDSNVLLVDFNLAWPGLFRLFEVKAGPGLAEVVLASMPVHEVLQSCSVPNLSILTAGAQIGTPARIYESKRLSELIDLFTQGFDLVIFDLPPIEEGNSVLSLLALLDGVVLVIEAERVRREVAERAKELVTRAQGKLFGAVMTKYQGH